MAKRRVYVHQIQAPADKNLLPLAAGLVTSYAQSIPAIAKKYDLEIKVLREKPEDTVNSYASPDVLAFSAYSWNFRQSLKIARLTKLEDPNVLVVLGGPMVGLSQRPEELETLFRDYPFVDIAVHGMGEWPFAEILLARTEGAGWDTISGLSYKNPESPRGFTSTPPAVFNRELDQLPSPFLDGTFDSVLDCYGGSITGALWETNRGCPFHCTFCVQGDGVFDRILMFDSQRLFDELEWMSQQKIEYIFATDANFGIKERDHEIAKKIADLKLAHGYPQYFMVNWTKNSSKKVLRAAAALKEGGIESRMTLGRQSFDEETLKAVKRKNIKLSAYDEMKQSAVANHVASYTEIILGLPNDSYQSFVESLEQAMDRQLTHFFVIYLCRLLAGTEMASVADRAKYEYDTRVAGVGFGRSGYVNQGVDELEEVIVGTATMPVQDWRRAHTFAYTTLAFYNTRLAFFVLCYLKQEHGIRLTDFFDYLITQAAVPGQYKLISRAIESIRRSQRSILDSGSAVVSLDFTGGITYEPHEAACLTLLNECDDFRQELWSLVNGFTKSRGLLVDQDVLKEVFKYQFALIPTWKRPIDASLSFEYNVPQYFDALCLGEDPIEISKETTHIQVEDDMEVLNDPVEFSKRKFTVALFKIAQVHSISTGSVSGPGSSRVASAQNTSEFI